MPHRPTPAAGAAATGFATLGLADSLIVASVAALGYEEPTPVQRETIPLLLAGRDLLGQAATGTGKTAAFALPMLQRMPQLGAERSAPHDRAGARADARARDAGGGGDPQVRARRRADACCRSTAARRCCQQIRALERGANIVVATPGRALDHIRRGTLDARRLRMLVLDEADEMLDMGFAEDLDAILEATPRRSGRRRCSRRRCRRGSCRSPSATCAIPRASRSRARRPAAGKLPRVRQVAYIVARAHKPAALERVLDIENARLGARVLPHAARGRHAGRDAQRARPPRRGAARRHGAAAARPRDGALPRGRSRSARRDRRRGARPRHRAAVARHQLRRAGLARRPTSTASAAPAAPDAKAPRSRWPSRASTACCAAWRRRPSRRSRSRRCRPSPTCARGGSN